MTTDGCAGAELVLANLATLLDVSPREPTDWFWVAYLDAFERVLAAGDRLTPG